MIYEMDRDDEKAVREIYALCHPDRPERESGWYWAFPTLVSENAQRKIVGFTSFSLTPGPTGILLYGNDLCVAPMYQRQGFGWALAEERRLVGRRLGAKGFVGVTTADNAPMQRIFERQGFHACQRLPGYFGAEDGWVWVGSL